MKTKIFYGEMRRSFRTVATFGLILLVVTAFFVMSLNLYSTGVRNLALADETYRTIAVMELYGDIDKWGGLSAPGSENYMGYHSVGVDGYDLSGIVSAAGVTGYDLRTRYAAYIKDQPAISDLNIGGPQTLMFGEDIIRFTLEKDQPVTIPTGWSEEYWDYESKGEVLFLLVSDSAASRLRYEKRDFYSDGIYMGDDAASRDYYADQVRKLNRSDETDYVTLYPGVEYIAATALQPGWEIHEDSKGFFVGPQIFSPRDLCYFRDDFCLRYSAFGDEWIDYTVGYQADQPFPVARWEDVQNDPQLKARWEAAWETLDYSMCSYNICLTDDISGVPVFHLGGTLISKGRMITEEEYAAGAKVCMVSRQMAELQGWYVGKKLNMSLYQFEAYPNSNNWNSGDQAVYHQNTRGFFDGGEYEIVGIFDQKTLKGNSGISASSLAVPWNMIFIPRNSVSEPPQEKTERVHAALLTLWLENGSIDAFLEDMDARGITSGAEGEYHPSFTFFDQGYSIVQPGLQRMHSTAKLLLILSGLLLVITCVLLAWFFAQNRKHTVGIFRMLGGKKRQAVTAVLLCALLITCFGAAPGAVLGHSLSQKVGETLLLEDLAESEEMAAIRAYVLATEETGGMELTAEADPALSAAAACAALLFPLLLAGFVLGYIREEPKALLPQKLT